MILDGCVIWWFDVPTPTSWETSPNFEVSLFSQKFQFLAPSQMVKKWASQSKIVNWVHDSYIFLNPFLSKFKFSMYTGQKNWHALHGALISKFTGAKSSGIFSNLDEALPFPGQEPLLLRGGKFRVAFLVGYFKLGRANCHHSPELVGVQFHYGKHVTCLPFPDVHSNEAGWKLRISKMFISMFFWSSMIYLFQVPSFPLKSGFGKNFPTKGTSTGWPEKYGTREVSSP